MKQSRWILFGVLLLGVALFVWHWGLTRSKTLSSELASSHAAQSEAKAGAMPPSSAPVTAPESSKSATALPVSKREQMESFLSATNHKAIEFYGKVVDQNGTPISDVGVFASVIYNSGLAAGVDKKQTKTDSDGLFAISGMVGRTLGIGLEKPGYEYGGEQGPFQFTQLVTEAERYKPDAKTPVLFVMYKLQGAEPLIYFERKAFPLPMNGTPVRIDLVSGNEVTSGGDLMVILKQPSAQFGQQLLHYPWTAEIAADGLLESSAKLMYLAPENGYASALSYGENGDERIQKNQITKSFYLRTADGRFARVRIDVTSRSNPEFPSMMGLTWWLNQKQGSRNLEFDPEKTEPHKPTKAR